MNILTAIKQVPDTGSLLQLKEGALDEEGIKWAISPYDEFALQEGLKLKAKLKGELFSLSLGPKRAKHALLTALSLGADKAFHLISSEALTPFAFDPLSQALLLSKKISKLPSLSLILCGKEAGDSNSASLPQMLAALLNLPFVSNVRKLDYEEGELLISRETKGGMEFLKAPLPLLISMGKGEKEPPPPSLMEIMRAAKKPFQAEEVEAEEESAILKRGGFRLESLKKPSLGKPPELLEGKPSEQVDLLLKILKEEGIL